MSLKRISSLKSVVKYSLVGSSRSVSSTSVKSDKVTHTGQLWEDDDPRNMRFLNSPKHVNEQFAIDLIKEAPPKPVKARIAICDGGPEEHLGHPKIYINLDAPGNHSCIYCGLRYYKATEEH